jgi:hypothetical protein
MEHGAAQDSVCLTAYIRVVDLLSAYWTRLDWTREMIKASCAQFMQMQLSPAVLIWVWDDSRFSQGASYLEPWITRRRLTIGSSAPNWRDPWSDGPTTRSIWVTGQMSFEFWWGRACWIAMCESATHVPHAWRKASGLHRFDGWSGD